MAASTPPPIDVLNDMALLPVMASDHQPEEPSAAADGLERGLGLLFTSPASIGWAKALFAPCPRLRFASTGKTWARSLCAPHVAVESMPVRRYEPLFPSQGV